MTFPLICRALLAGLILVSISGCKAQTKTPMNKQPLPEYSYESLFNAQQKEQVLDWLAEPGVRKGKVFKIPVTFTLHKTFPAADKCFIGWQDPLTEEQPMEMKYSDSRMGEGLDSRLQMLEESIEGQKRAWIIGSWDTEILSLNGDELVFFIRDVKPMGEGDSSVISLGKTKSN